MPSKCHDIRYSDDGSLIAIHFYIGTLSIHENPSHTVFGTGTGLLNLNQCLINYLNWPHLEITPYSKIAM